jgi:putative flippase GtrA
VARLLKFLSVGAAGFVVDFTTMCAMITFAHLAAIPARLIAFAVSIVFTYIFNRAFTFADRPRRGGEWMRYTLVSAVAAAVNLGAFATALQALGTHAFAPYIAMPIGVAVGLLVNFFCYNFLVFRAASTTER